MIDSLADQAAAARHRAALFDVSDRTQFELRGRDRAKFLHSFCTNDIQNLPEGQGCEAFLLNVMGRMLGHVAVFAAADALWVDGVPGQETALIAHLDKYLIREDVEFVAHSADYGELWLAGPEVLGLLTAVLGIGDLSAEELLTQQTLHWQGTSLWLRRIDWLGAPGWLVSGPQAAVDGLRQALVSHGVTTGSPEVLESLRIEAGYPVYGRDLSAENLAQEAARTPRSISFRKGCYLGQEPVARLDALGHTNKELRRLKWAGTTVPPAGTAIFDPTGAIPAGVITSAAPVYDATEPTVAAIAFVKTKWNGAGGQVRVGENTAEVVGGE